MENLILPECFHYSVDKLLKLWISIQFFKIFNSTFPLL